MGNLYYRMFYRIGPPPFFITVVTEKSRQVLKNNHLGFEAARVRKITGTSQKSQVRRKNHRYAVKITSTLEISQVRRKNHQTQVLGGASEKSRKMVKSHQKYALKSSFFET